jgi:hypothetical protein
VARFRFILAVVVALFALLTLADRFLLLELNTKRLAFATGLALLEAIAITATGMLARRRGSDPALDFLVGYPLFGTLCFLIGLAKISPWTMLPLVIIGAIAWPLARARHDAPPAYRLPPSAIRFTDLLPLVAIAVTLLCALVIAQAPPATSDELAHHLAVPRAWAVEGRTVELPLLPRSYWPLGIESADLPLLATLAENGAIASHILHLIAALAAIALLVRRTSSWLATAAIATTPALALIAGASFVEWPLTGICIALAAALESEDDRTATIAAAAGLLTSYTFVPFAILAFAIARKWRPALPALAIGAVFFVRNLILAGNPFEGVTSLFGRRAAYLTDYIFEGTNAGDSLASSLLGMAFGASGGVAWGSLALAIALLVGGAAARVLVPYLAVAATTAAPLLQRRLFAIVISVAIVVQTFFVAWVTEQTGAFALLAGRVTEQEHITAKDAMFPAIAWLNATLPASSRTLVVGHAATFWFSRPVRGGDGEALSRYLAAPAPEALREKLRRDGITHVAVLSSTPPVRLSADAQRMLAQTLDREASSVATRGADSLFTLRR